MAIDIDVSDDLLPSDNNLFGGSARSAKGKRRVRGVKGCLDDDNYIDHFYSDDCFYSGIMELVQGAQVPGHSSLAVRDFAGRYGFLSPGRGLELVRFSVF